MVLCSTWRKASTPCARNAARTHADDIDHRRFRRAVASATAGTFLRASTRASTFVWTLIVRSSTCIRTPASTWWCATALMVIRIFMACACSMSRLASTARRSKWRWRRRRAPTLISVRWHNSRLYAHGWEAWCAKSGETWLSGQPADARIRRRALRPASRDRRARAWCWRAIFLCRKV
jgi:hypothetical protein